MPKCLKPVYYLQGDPRWGGNTYKSPSQSHQTIRGAGCGITCAAMVIATLCPSSKTTPAETAKWSMAHGYKETSGTSWGYFVPQFKEFKLSCKFVSKSDAGNRKIKAALRSGENFVIASMAPGNWTSGGHYILAYYMDKTYVYINDPASTKSHRTKNKISLFTSEAKAYWIISHSGQVKDYTGTAWDFADTDDNSEYADNGITGVHLKLIDETNRGKGNSDLAGYINTTSGADVSRSTEINCITIHSALATGSLAKLAQMIKSSNTSYNYGIDNEGTIGMYVPESYSANATGNEDNDARSVNIVCMNTKASGDYPISADCLDSLIDLCEDICRRRYITQLVYNKKKPEEGTLTLHSQFASKGKDVCPGKYILSKLDYIIETVNTRLNMENMQRVTVTSFQADSETTALRAQSTVSLGAISPYVAVIGHDTFGTNYRALLELGVVGLRFHGGARWDKNHVLRDSWVDIHFPDIIAEFKKSGVNLPYAIEYTTRAKTVEEAKQECDGFFYLLAAHRPKLGAWVKCELDIKNSDLAADIVDVYYEHLVKWGFKSKCGIVATKAQAKLIQWPRQSAYMPLWLEGEMDEKVAPVEEILTPSYFKLDDLTNKGYNANEDQDTVQQAVNEMKSKFNFSLYTDGSDAAGSTGAASSDLTGLKPGQSLSIPQGMGGSFTVTMYGQLGWYLKSKGWVKISKGTGQDRVHDKWVKAGCKWDEGIAVLDGFVLIAMTKTFGDAGSTVQVEFSNGYKMNAVLADTKNPNDVGCNQYGHDNGRSVVEFEVMPSYHSKYGNPGSAKWWKRIQGARVTKVTKLDKKY